MRQRKIWSVLLFCLCVGGCGGGGGGGGGGAEGGGSGGNSGDGQAVASPRLELSPLDIAGTARLAPSITMGALEAI